MEGKTTGDPSAEESHICFRTSARVLSVVALGGILALAAYLRLWGLEHSPTGGDQAVLLNIALRWVTQGKFPLAGNKSSVGLMNPPLLEYLLAIPLFFRRDMIWAAWFVALVNLASVALTFFVVRPIFGLRVGLLSTLLYAVNPWAIYYSRLIWNPTMIPFFSTLLLGSLLAAFTGRRRAWHLTLTFLWLAGAIQLHLASVALIPAVGLLFWLFRDKVTLRPLLVGTFLFLLTFVPFLIYETETGFMDLADFRQAIRGMTKVNLASVALGLELASETGIWHTMGKAWSQWRATVAWGEGLGAVAHWFLLAGLLVAGGWLLVACRGLLRRRDEFQARRLAAPTVSVAVMSVLFAVPLLFYVRHTAYLQNYYFLYLYPLPFVFMALPADAMVSWAGTLPTVWRRVTSPLAWLPTIFLLALAAWQFNLNHVGLQLISRGVGGKRQIWHVQSAIDTFMDWSHKHPGCDLIIASDGYHAESSILGQVGEFLAPQPVRYVRLGSGVIVPRTCALYLVASDDAAVRGWYEVHASPLPGQTIPLPQDDWHFYAVMSPERNAIVETFMTSPPVGQWDNGLQLQSYAMPDGGYPGASVKLTLIWEVYGPTPKRQYHFFNHLLDDSGTLAAQVDGPGVFSRYWQPGEFLVTWFEVAVPASAEPGTYQVLVGLYDWPSLERSRLTGGQDSLTLGPVEILAE